MQQEGKGIVVDIYINRLERGMIQDEPKSDVHKVETKELQAKVNNNGEDVAVNFDITDVLNHYNRKNVNVGLKELLKLDLCGKTIEYGDYDGGIYHLVGSISDYI